MFPQGSTSPFLFDDNKHKNVSINDYIHLVNMSQLNQYFQLLLMKNL